jgi:hypothetical protein
MNKRIRQDDRGRGMKRRKEKSPTRGKKGVEGEWVRRRREV